MDSFERAVIDRLGRIETKLDGSHERLDDIEAVVYGIGFRPGLQERMATQEERTMDAKSAGVGSAIGGLVMAALAYIAREMGV